MNTHTRVDIHASRLLHRLDDALLLVGPDLCVRQVLTQAAYALGGVGVNRRELVALPLSQALAPLLAPKPLADLIKQISALAESPGETPDTLRGVEGAATAALRAAGLTRYYDIWMQPYIGDEGLTLLLGLRDVTERLRLERELESAREAHELALGVLRADPQALEEFMTEALQGISLLHSLVKMPARSELAFRSKLSRIADEVESLAKQASTVRLSSINRCALALVNDIQTVLQQPAVSGDDFLPLSVGLDELFVQINNTGRLAEQRAGRAISNERADVTGSYRTLADWSADLGQRLQILVDRFGLQSQHSADLALNGLQQVPENQQRNVESILVQLVRNAIEHGIETANRRLAGGKSAKGQISVDCTVRAGQGLQLDIRDDGCGFDLNLIRRLAIEQGLATAEELDNAQPDAISNLLVRPGFNSAGLVSDSGRGLGMEFLRELVLRIGGQISVSSQPGQQTHLSVVLPEQGADEALIETQRVA